MAMKGDLFVVSAPSGAGKTTLCRRLLEELPGIAFSVSHTTRAPRKEERDGVSYHFVSRQRFIEMREAGEFLEWAEVHGNLYGTSKGEVTSRLSRGEDVLLDIDVQGARRIRERFPEAVSVFVLPPSWEALEKRLAGRGTEDPEVLARRLTNARAELDAAHEYDYIVVNDEIDRAVADLVGIVRARRCLATRVLADRPVLNGFFEGLGLS